MMSTTSLRCGTTGRAVLLGSAVGPPGAEGRVYTLSDQGGQVAKLYHGARLAGGGLEAKLAAMVAAPPDGIREPGGHWSVAWPLTLLRDAGDAFVGFTMPAVQSSLAAKWHMLANPSDRGNPPASRSWTTGFDWRYRLHASANLADAVGSILDAGYVPGDLSGDNVFVYRNALVTIIDADSMQVPAPGGGSMYYCTVWRDEYLAPELAGQRDALDRSVRRPESALFALAVLIYEMLMEGRHPFGGVWSGSGEPPSRLSLAAEGSFVDGPDPRLNSGPGALDPAVLPPELRTLFDRAFVRGATEPAGRPSCPEWRRCLHRAAAAVSTCRRGSHPYPGHLDACPWCRRTARSTVPPPRKPAERPAARSDQRAAKTAPPAPLSPTTPPKVTIPAAPRPSSTALSSIIAGFICAIGIGVLVVALVARVVSSRSDPVTMKAVDVWQERIAHNAPIGTCITKQGWEADLHAITPVPCDQPHWGEILGYPRLAPSPSPYPGDEQVQALAVFRCGLLLAELGLDRDRYQHTQLYALSQWWNAGASEFENYATCVVYARDPLPEQLVRADQTTYPDASVQMTLYAIRIGSNAPTGACVAARDGRDRSPPEVPVVPCERRHWAEVLGYPVLYSATAPWPGDTAVEAAAVAACRTVFTARQLSPQFTYHVIWPTRDWWSTPPKRGIYTTCLAHRADNQEFAGPMR